MKNSNSNKNYFSQSEFESMLHFDPFKIRLRTGISTKTAVADSIKTRITVF